MVSAWVYYHGKDDKEIIDAEIMDNIVTSVQTQRDGEEGEDLRIIWLVSR
jgi:hypothetical protein